MPALFRNLRIACSAFCVAACILFIVLWVRTTYACESMFGPFLGNSSLVVTSRQGGIGIGISWTRYPNWSYITNPPETVPDRKYVTFLGLAYANPPGEGIYLRGPYALAIAAAIILSALPWVHWKARFSLRTLLIAMTAVALLMGLSVLTGR